ncbi:nuclear factor interleukin-3-regulated protein-like [Dendronephthya gigantea]|uniref:nuclear factor interleukin-3-regulated protein-like n=1 Tax=Dendronephthya gigantea TaxID=151771 RepID=UPI00106B8EEA|nr:nuclear factor interleukin-3-regulated protein-like [Dendronephthya gigantea]
MEEEFMLMGNEFCGLSESNESTDGSLDGSDGDFDMLAAFKGTELDDLFNACSGFGIRSEIFDQNQCMYAREAYAPECKPKTRSSNKAVAKNEPGYLTERIHWNYRQKRVNYDPRPISKRSRKRSIPDEMKDDAYWKKRCQNTERARKSREARRLKEIEVLQKVKTLEDEKLELQQQVDSLKSQVQLLNERLLKHEQQASFI